MIDLSRDVIFDYGAIKNSEFLKDDFGDDNSVTRHQNNLPCTEEDDGVLPYIQNDPIISVRNVFFKYPTQNDWILKDVNFDITQGENVLIIGEIGSGKSTLIKIILRLLRPSEGHIRMKGACYGSYSTKSFYKRIGFMPQNCILFNRSVIENIQYDNSNISDEEIINSLHDFGIMKHFSNLQDGVHSMCGKNGMNLSGGQRQLVWFLKLYFKGSDVIIMDEPTASLDKGTKDLFKDIMNRLLKNKTIIIVTHDDHLLDIADRTITMKNGEVIIK
jgi:ABC-type bacteriocin/lantibiotic exporter with double-glycine peptidase domain